MIKKFFSFVLLTTLLISTLQIRPAHADAGDCFYTPPDTITCTTGGSGENGDDGGGGSGSGDGEVDSCTEIIPAEI